MSQQARQEAQERLAVAEKAADEALADARAMSNGLRSLGEALSAHAEQILRDVQAGHRRLRADLRLAGGGPAAEPAARQAAARGDTGLAGRTRRGSPFEDLDVPRWVGPE